jgi:hypothetical protein
MATYGGLRVISAVSGATTVPADCYAIVTYTVTGYPSTSGVVTGADVTNVLANNTGNSYGDAISGVTPVTRTFGPGQTIPATFTSVVGLRLSFTGNTTFVNASATWTLQSGVVLGP